MKIQAKTLEEAFSQAAKHFSCSVSELETKVIQHPRAGIMGLFAKDAIIEADRKGQKNEQTSNHENTNFQNKTKKVPCEDVQNCVPKIKEDLEKLLQTSCFQVSLNKIELYDKDTIYIEINGEDAALLIGRDGCRYNAFSHMLYSWLSLRYSLNLRLEIAQFLQNQEIYIDKYIEMIEQKVLTNPRLMTKTFEGALIKIVYDKLRKKYPDKYVAIKSNKIGEKFVIVNSNSRKSN